MSAAPEPDAPARPSVPPLLPRWRVGLNKMGSHSAFPSLRQFTSRQQFLHYLGFYVALAELPDYTPAGRNNPMYNYPGHLAGIAAYNDKALAVFMFRSPWIEYDYHDLAAQKRIPRRRFRRPQRVASPRIGRRRSP